MASEETLAGYWSYSIGSCTSAEELDVVVNSRLSVNDDGVVHNGTWSHWPVDRQLLLMVEEAVEVEEVVVSTSGPETGTEEETPEDSSDTER